METFVGCFKLERLTTETLPCLRQIRIKQQQNEGTSQVLARWAKMWDQVKMVRDELSCKILHSLFQSELELIELFVVESVL